MPQYEMANRQIPGMQSKLNSTQRHYRVAFRSIGVPTMRHYAPTMDTMQVPDMTRRSAFPNTLMGLFLAISSQLAVAAPTTSAASLLAKRVEFQDQLQAKTFDEPLYLASREERDRVEGDVYAELAIPFTRVNTVLGSAESVCALLFLHLNIRSCAPTNSASGETLTLSVGPKRAAAAGAVYSMTYNMHVDVANATYQKVTLLAAEGPLSTKDYRIVFESTPIESNRTFLHFGYAYGTGTLAKLAMGAYLATAGRSKIGFTVTGTQPDGRTQYVQGERASLERNVIRNYFALVAYSGVTAGTPQAQRDARLRAWFALTERHAAQLHELDLAEYLQQKHNDLERMASRAP
jgi:hypothetical protein